MPFNSNFERKTRKDKLMNLITCKKFRGGGNSLKFRVKSEEVRVGRAIRRLAASIAIITALAAAQSAWAAYYAWSGGGSSPFYFDDTANWGFKTSGGGMWITVPAIGSRSDALNIDPTLLVNDGKGNGTTATFEGKTVRGVAYDVNWNKSFPSTWNKTITFRTTTSLTSDIVLNSADETISFVATAADCGVVSSSRLYFKPSSNLQIESGTYSFGGDIVVAGTLSVSGAMLKNAQRYIQVGSGGNGTVTIGPGGVYENFGNLGSLTVAHTSGHSGTLNVAGGTVSISGWLTMCYNASSVSAAVNVTDGGVLAVKRLVLGNAGTSGGVVTLDGGTLRAYADESPFVDAHDSLRVYAGANGATFDSNGKTITIAESIEDKSGEAGVVRFTGGGTITLSGTPSYTGGTTNVAGTVLSLTTAAKSAIVAHPVVVEIPAAGAVDGTVVFEVTDGGTFSQSEVDAMVVTGTDASRYALVLAYGGTKVVISDTLAGEYVWNDGASAASWKTAGKWSKNNVAGNWYDSTAAVFANAGDAVTVDADVTAASVTFRADATVGGAATLKVPVVDVASGVAATISAPTADPLEKTGAGTLTLGASRTDTTTLSDGTLVMSGTGTTLDWSKFTFGTDVSKPVTLKFENGATVANASAMRFGAVAGMTNTVYKECGDWTVSGNFLMGLSDGPAQTFYHNGGELTVGGYFSVGDFDGGAGVSHVEINGGTVNITHAGNYTAIGSLSDGTAIVKNGGTLNATGNLLVGNKAAGTMTIDNGGVVNVADIIFAYNETGRDSLFELKKGGELSVDRIYYRNGTIAEDTFLFNGGTLKCKSSELITAHDRLFVKVASNGGIIDLDGRTVAIEEPLLEDAESTGGGMAFIGGGSVTLASGNTYTGTTTVEVGTTVHVAAQNEIGGGLAVMVPETTPADGVYTLVAIDGEGTFNANVLSSVVPPANVKLRLSVDAKSVLCIYGNPPNVWIGGATGSLSDNANWSLGTVPRSGESCVIGNATGANLTNPSGSVFAPASITFPATSAAVTINGEFSGITQIVNNSPSMVEFTGAVEFADTVDVTGGLKFTGGVTGKQLANATDIHGIYNFTKEGDLTEIANTTVKSDGVYNLLDGTFYKNDGDFHVEAGGKAVVKDAKIISTAKDGAHLLGTFNGLFVVTNQFFVQGDSTHYLSTSGSGTLVMNELRVIQNGKIALVKAILGHGGIVRGAGYVRVYNNGSCEYGSYDDWTMYHNSKGTNTATESPVFYKHSSSSTWSYLTFDTTDYYDNTIGRTITCEAPISAADAASAEKFRVTVKGKGKFVFANTSDGNIFSGGLIVQDTATVEVKANAKPGNGTITLGAGTTLALTSTSNEFTPLVNTLNLPTGENEVATIRIDGKRLRSGEGLEIATIGNAASVTKDNVKIEGDAIGGRKTTLRIEGGKLMLNVKPDGTMIIVR